MNVQFRAKQTIRNQRLLSLHSEQVYGVNTSGLRAFSSLTCSTIRNRSRKINVYISCRDIILYVLTLMLKYRQSQNRLTLLIATHPRSSVRVVHSAYEVSVLSNTHKIYRGLSFLMAVVFSSFFLHFQFSSSLRNLENSDPCSGLVRISAIISLVGR